MSGQKVVLDANVLYGEFLRDLLLSLFYAGMIEAKWTAEITDEWMRNLLARKPRLEKKLPKTVFDCTAFCRARW